MCFCCVLVLFRMLKTGCQFCSTEPPLRPLIAEFINGALDRCMAMFHFFLWRFEGGNADLMGDLPSGYVNSLLLKMAIEIVDFPIKHGDFP